MWFKVDDSFHSHPKALASEPAALGLWVVAGSWCGDNLTDGLIPAHVLPRLVTDAVQLAETLVTAGLWKRTRGGFQFHNWAKYQPSKSQVIHNRQMAAQRQSTARSRKTTSSSDSVASRRDSRVSNTVTHGVSHTTPTRPDPPPTGERVGGHGYPQTNGQRQDQHRREEPTRFTFSQQPPHGVKSDNAERCPRHAGQPAGTCGSCRAEAIQAPSGAYPVVNYRRSSPS